MERRVRKKLRTREQKKNKRLKWKRENMEEIEACISRPSFLPLSTFPLSKTLPIEIQNHLGLFPSTSNFNGGNL